MTRKNYPACLDHVLKSEGGYVDHPRDPGGATNFGITIGTLSHWLGRPATKQEVRDIPRSTVEKIYKRNYWDKVKGDNLPAGMDLVAFDGGVNSGPYRGAQWLQKGLGVRADGVVGDHTLEMALSAQDGVKVIQRACASRLGFLRGLRTWSTFGRGWGRRVASVEAEAVAMHSGAVRVVLAEEDAAKVSKSTTEKQAAASGATGGASTLADLPDVVTYGLIGLAVIVAILLLTKSRQHNRRANAYKKKAKEMING